MPTLTGTAPPQGGKPNTLALCSLFEGNFSIDWLISLTGEKPSAILESLESAVEKGWLSKTGFSQYRFADDERKKEFSQGLPQEDAIILKRRIAGLLLRELPEGEEKARKAAAYLLDIPNDLEQCRWLAAAGDIFLKSLNAKKAHECYLKVLGSLPAVQGGEGDSVFIDTAVKFSRIADVDFDIRRTQRLLKEALRRAEGRRDLRSAALLQMHLAKNEWYRSNYPEALKRFETGWALAQEVNDPRLRRSALTFGAFFHYWQGRFQEAVNLYESELSGMEDSLPSRFSLMAESTLANCYNFVGQAAQGFGMIHAIRARSIQAGDSFIEGFNGLVMAISLINIQRHEEAMEHLETAAKEARKWPRSPMSVICHLMKAYVHFQGGSPKKAVRHVKEFLKLREQIQVSMWPYPYLLELCWAMEERRLPPVPGLSLPKEMDRAKNTKNLFMIGIAHRFQALDLQKKGAAVKDVLRCLKISEQNLEQSGHVLELLRVRLLLVNHFRAQGDEAQAQAILESLSEALSRMPVSMVPADLWPLRREGREDDGLAGELWEVCTRVMETRDWENLLGQLLSLACRAVGAERGAVFVAGSGEEGREFALAASRNLTLAQTGLPCFDEAWKAVRKAARSGQGVFASQASQSFPGGDDPIRSLLCIPLRLRGRTLGVLYHDNRMLLDVFQESHLKQLRPFAALIALAADNRRVREKLRAIEQGALDGEAPVSGQVQAHGMVGQSQALQQVLDHIRQVAPSEATVLILGETGVGKELVARAIHESSPRKDGPFISVNCNALPDSLISSELFGHEKGAFTGALQRRAGRFELAAGGSLLLDEIGELPLETQVKLLRVLQTREFERIGGNETIASDFRLIAATNRDLQQETGAGRFRADLFYRLNAFPITVPPLRERKEDIPLLARHFLRLFSLRAGKRFTSFPDSEMSKLLGHEWPGNVRELENVMERGVIMGAGAVFQAPGLLEGAVVPAPAFLQGPGMSLQEVERRHILQTLERTRWKIRGRGGAAEFLDIHPSTLYSRMKKLGIRKE